MGVYNEVNNALLCDDPDRLEKYGCFMRAVNRFISSHPAPRNVKLYRGTKIQEKQKYQVKKGDAGRTFRQPLYVASSLDSKVAGEFTEKGSPVMEFLGQRLPQLCGATILKVSRGE